MVTYRPVKQIFILILALIIGMSLSFWLIPSKMDYEWNIWRNRTLEWETKDYEINGIYTFDGVKATTEVGDWSEGNSQFNLTSVVSDDSTFQFQVFFEDEKIFIDSGGKWLQTDINSRFVEELTPLYHPFEWIREILNEADKVERIKDGDKTTFRAIFDSFEEFDFRGTLLSKQHKTTLIVIEKNGVIQSVTFEARPIRPDSISILDRYPEQMSYKIDFTEIESAQFVLPKEAYESELME